VEANIEALEEQLATVAPVLQAARDEMAKVLVGQRGLVDRLLIGLLANGHVLIEGVPGLAKTTAVKALSDALALEFKRIQFTPDLLPADVVGTQIYQPSSGEFTTKKGPVFTHVLLSDEINRAPPKVQSALLESMQERQVTLGDTTYVLPAPFLVLATQNPLEQEGTYPLPEAQMDRFLMKLSVDYPSLEEEMEILERSSKAVPSLSHVASAQEILAAQALVSQVHISDVLRRYIVDLVRATRAPESVDADLRGTLSCGASPRASIALAACARAHAVLDGRGYALPEDVKAVAPDVLRHRMLLTYEAEAEGLSADRVVERILAAVEMQ
jgi:MoxR-like ATPase